MAHAKWCGKDCSECEQPCLLDQRIPCSPNCELLNEDGSIKISECVQSGCDAYKSYECGRDNLRIKLNKMEDEKMLINKNGQSFESEGKVFTIGGKVVANATAGIYKGLIGFVAEISTDADKDTDNTADDICVSFLSPSEPACINSLEKTFSEAHGQSKTINEIALDSVIMAPEMLDIDPDAAYRPMRVLKNVTERKEFIEDYKKWGLWREIPELNLKFYRYPFPDGSCFVVAQYASPGGQFHSQGEGHKFHLIKDELGYTSYDPSGCGMGYLVDHLTKNKFEVCVYE